MSMERSVSLKKGWVIDWNRTGYLQAKDVELTWNPSSSSEMASRLVSAISKCLREMKPEEDLLRLNNCNIVERTRIRITPWMNGIGRLCRILPEPFLQVICRTEAPPSIGGTIVEEKRLKLGANQTGQLKDETFNNWTEIFVNNTKGETNTGSAEFELILGWKETELVSKPEPETKPEPAVKSDLVKVPEPPPAGEDTEEGFSSYFRIG